MIAAREDDPDDRWQLTRGRAARTCPAPRHRRPIRTSGGGGRLIHQRLRRRYAWMNRPSGALGTANSNAPGRSGAPGVV
jgi:hypothetical protein